MSKSEHESNADGAGKRYIQRQTARRLLEGVARELDRTGVRLTKAGDRLNGDYLHAQAEQVRDALALLVGD